MPSIGIPVIDREAAISSVLASVALMEAGLAHILNAEGEKIQKALQMPCLTFDQMIKLNHSVSEIVADVADLEAALHEKVCAIARLTPKGEF
jgi:DNA-binding protein